MKRMSWIITIVASICISTVVTAQSGKLLSYESFSQLEKELQKTDDTVRVVNFWATWCKPCVAEMPFFEDAQANYAGKPVKVLLVSLDFKNQIEKKLMPFVQEKGIKSQVVVLTDPNANAWIAKVDPAWTGAIPATLIYRKDKRTFKEGEYKSYGQLVGDIEKIMK